MSSGLFHLFLEEEDEPDQPMPDPAQEREMTEPHSSHVVLHQDLLDSRTQEFRVFDKCLQTFA